MFSLRLRARAFTLIELLIVITIIGILAVALVPRLIAGTGKARDAARQADLQQIATALELYNSDNGGYPAATSGNCASGLSSVTGWSTSYMTTTPNDPRLDGATSSSSACTTGYSYFALNTDTDSAVEGFMLWADLETESARGAGIYTAPTGTVSTSSSGSSYASLLSGSYTACPLGTTTGCADVIYIVGK